MTPHTPECPPSEETLDLIGTESNDLHNSYLAATEKLSSRVRSLEIPILYKSVLKDEVPGTHEEANASAGQSLEAVLPASHELSSFSTIGQRRRGSRHGKGGRKVGSRLRTRQKFGGLARFILGKRLQILFERNREDVTNRLLPSSGIPAYYSSFQNPKEAFTAQISIGLFDMASGIIRGNMEILPSCVIGVCTRFTSSENFGLQQTESLLSAKSKHVICTWLDHEGNARCTCIGSTQFRLICHKNHAGTVYCEHASSLIETVTSLMDFLYLSPVENPGKLIHKAFSPVFRQMQSSQMEKLPFCRSLFNGKVVVVVCSGPEKISGPVHASGPCWVPIRRLTVSRIRNICAFCDLIDGARCVHSQYVLKVKGDPPLPEEIEKLNPTDFNDEEGNGPKKDHEAIPDFISFLPLAPVNCAKAIAVDENVRQAALSEKKFRIRAPLKCTVCKYPRTEGRSRIHVGGVITCSLGPCDLEVESFECSNCNAWYTAEGRDEAILLHTTNSAATHAFLRQELCGMARTNGTLTGRLKHAHSTTASYIDSGILPSSLDCKSISTVRKLCIHMARLMVVSVPRELFCCDRCGLGGAQHAKGGIVCMDGVWAGYLQRSRKAFQNVYQECKAMKRSRAISNKQNLLPRSSLLRLDKTVSLVLRAIRGEKLDVTQLSLPSAFQALRLFDADDSVQPIYSESICGRTGPDFDFDIGECPLQNLQVLTKFLFDKKTAAYRIMLGIQSCLRRARVSKNDSKKKVAIEELCDDQERAAKKRKTLPRCQYSVTELLQIVESNMKSMYPKGCFSNNICWRDESLGFGGDREKEIFFLYQALLQGPTVHLIKRGDIQAAKDVADFCQQPAPSALLTDLQNRESITYEKGYSKSSARESFLRRNRLILAGILTSLEYDSRQLLERNEPGLTALFGAVILDSAQLVEEFYMFYDSNDKLEKASAFSYRTDWQSTDSSLLRTAFQALAKSEKWQSGKGIDYDDPYRTGSFFPALPQVRPLPFYDEFSGKTGFARNSKQSHEDDKYGFCSKNFLQRHGSFTPGAICVCCSCSHPIGLGFKVLEKDEGVRAVLDILISRFATLPEYIIYDFACGVQRSACHTLWWALSNSTLVSDLFHHRNHVCSPSFQPTSYSELDVENTVSHEQRNRPITQIKPSLQKTTQDVYISLLAYQMTINNLKAKAKARTETAQLAQNRSPEDLEWSYFSLLRLKCMCCQSPSVSDKVIPT